MGDTSNTKNIFPLSPYEHGGNFVISHGYSGVVVTDSTVEAASNTTRAYFSHLSDAELKDFDLFPELVKREDFVRGVVDLTRVLGSLSAAREFQEAYDRGVFPHIEADKLEQDFAL